MSPKSLRLALSALLLLAAVVVFAPAAHAQQPLLNAAYRCDYILNQNADAQLTGFTSTGGPNQYQGTNTTILSWGDGYQDGFTLSNPRNVSAGRATWTYVGSPSGITCQATISNYGQYIVFDNCSNGIYMTCWGPAI